MPGGEVPEPPENPRKEDSGDGRVVGALVGLFAAAFAATRLVEAARASHDAGAVRTLSNGYSGLLRGLDAVLAAGTTLVPLGSRGARAGAIAVAATFAVGFLAIRLVFALRARLGGTSRVGAFASCLGVVAVLLGASWDVESHAASGAALGVLLVFAPMACLVSPRRLGEAAPPSKRALLRATLFLALALSYEPFVGLAAILGASPFVDRRSVPRRERAGFAIAAGLAFLGGAAPLAAAAFRLDAKPGSLIALPFEAWLGEGPIDLRTPAQAIVALTGYLLPAGALGTVAWSIRPGRAAPDPSSARRIAVALVGIVAVGGLGLVLGAPSGPSRVAAPILAAVVALAVLAGPIVAFAIDGVARASIPLAQTSAALLVLLGASYPARFLDDAITARSTRAIDAGDAWADAAFSTVPDRAVVLVGSSALWTHLMADRARGTLRPDLLLVPYFAPASSPMARAIAIEPGLVPLYRDLVLRGAPSELAMSKLAEARPVIYDPGPSWDRALARHVVPAGLFLRFYAEPHGQTERLRVMEEWRAPREHLAVRIADRQKDTTLRRLTIALLRRRAFAMAQSNDRESATRALDDLRAFDGDDPFATKLTRRLVGARGNIDVGDLVP